MESMNFGNLTIARPGTKVSGAGYPELITGTGMNKFTLNGQASALMNLATGNTISILVNPEATSINDMYFLTEGIAGNESKLASVNKAEGVGRVLNFNYSGVYSRMLQGTTDAVELSPEGLVNKGLATKRTTEGGNSSYTALKRYSFRVSEGVEVEVNGTEMVVYPLVDAKEVDYEVTED